MEVDRLKPGTSPLSSETLLWFEFLLDPTLLEKHLNKSNPDPSPTDLIVKFLNVDKKEEAIVLDDENGDCNGHSAPKITKKSLSIKLLSLRVAAFLNWDLDVFEIKLVRLFYFAPLVTSILFIMNTLKNLNYFNNINSFS